MDETVQEASELRYVYLNELNCKKQNQNATHQQAGLTIFYEYKKKNDSILAK